MAHQDFVLLPDNDSLTNPTLLLVERPGKESERYRTLAKRRAGFRVLTAKSAPMTRVVTQRSRPDLVLLSPLTGPPGASELARSIKEDPKTSDIPTMISSTALVHPCPASIRPRRARLQRRVTKTSSKRCERSAVADGQSAANRSLRAHSREISATTPSPVCSSSCSRPNVRAGSSCSTEAEGRDISTSKKAMSFMPRLPNDAVSTRSKECVFSPTADSSSSPSSVRAREP